MCATVRGELARPSLQVLRTARLLPLEPLSPEEVAELAEGCLGVPPSTEVLERLHRAAGGLPLLVEDLVSDDTSSRFDELVRARLDGLPATSQRLAVAAALLGESFDRHRLSLALPEEDDSGITKGLEDAVAALVVVPDGGGFRFRHALVRDVVVAWAPGLVSELTASVAAALETSGADNDLARAADLWAAAGDDHRSSRLLLPAARIARQRGPFHAPPSLRDPVVVPPPGAGRHCRGPALSACSERAGGWPRDRTLADPAPRVQGYRSLLRGQHARTRAQREASSAVIRQRIADLVREPLAQDREAAKRRIRA